MVAPTMITSVTGFLLAALRRCLLLLILRKLLRLGLLLLLSVLREGLHLCLELLIQSAGQRFQILIDPVLRVHKRLQLLLNRLCKAVVTRVDRCDAIEYN